MIRVKWLVFLAVTAVTHAQQDGPAEWNAKGLAASEHSEFAEAERLYLKAIDGWRSRGVEFDAHRATALVNLGQTKCAQGDRHKGAEAFAESVALYRKTLGLENERTLTAINLHAASLLMLGEAARGEALLNEILPVERRLFPASLQLARTLAAFAILNTNRGHPDAAIPLVEESLRLAIAAEGEISVDVALDYTVAAEAHRVARQNDRALPLYRKARYIYEKILDPEHPRVASILGQEGLILMQEGKLALAEQSMTRAIEVIAKRCPGCTIEQWVAESNLGMLRFKQKRYAEADALLSHSLALQERDTQHPGPDMASTIQALAIVRKKLNHPDDAARLNQRADMLLSLR